ncbi:MAG: alkane 1-monooxygenase [Pseudomonadota bacterium]
MTNDTIKMSSWAKFLSRTKRYGYIIAPLVIALMPVAAFYLGDHTQYTTLKIWSTFIFVFGLLPIIDHFVGEDPTNFDDDTMQSMASDMYYKWITLLILPLYATLLVWGMHALSQLEWLSWFNKLGWMIAIGLFGGALGITTAHELIHKKTKTEQVAGGLLLSLVCYAGFKIEHIYGHHVHVSTPEDASSSRYNQSLYQFLPQAYVRNFNNAWVLQKKRMERRGQNFYSFNNELINYYGLSIALMVMFTVWQGALGLVYFLVTSFVAFTLLEIVNYLEHYGLHREKQDNGRYEKVTPHHSWNSNHLATNLFLFHLQRHSDHHAYPNRRYQVLRNFDDIPQLPSGYAAMIVLAVIPPLWRKVMNPRVEQYYEGRMQVLNGVAT